MLERCLVVANNILLGVKRMCLLLYKMQNEHKLFALV